MRNKYNKSTELKKPKQSATNYGLWCISRKNWSIQDLSTKLVSRGYPTEEAASAISRLIELRYLNDETYAGSKVRTISARKGNRAVAHELQSSGISTEMVAAALGEVPEEAERAIDCARRFKGKCSTREEVAKLWRFLAYRGFGTPAIKAAAAFYGIPAETDDEDFVDK